MATLMETLTKIKDFFVKYWKLVVGTVTGVFIFLLGIFAASKDTSKEKVKTRDAEALAKANAKIMEVHGEAFERFVVENERLKKEKEEKATAIEKNKLDRVDDLRNNPEKLDTILEEEFGLKKGE